MAKTREITREDVEPLRDFFKEREPLWKPFPNSPQELAYHSEASELLFGGAAGCGKTGMAVGLALTKHKRSLLLRRTSVDTKEIVDQLKHFADGHYRWKSIGPYGGEMRTDDGRMIEVGGCQHEEDKQAYKGRPHDLIIFDEAADFSQSAYRFIIAWNRHENPNQRCRVILPTNPPTTPEGRWLVEEFAPWVDPSYPNPAKPGELRWYTTLDGKLTWVDGPDEFMHKGEMIKPKSRSFIPGRLSDNPILSATDYGAQLQALPEPLRSQLLYGDFNAGTEDDPWQVIPTDWVHKAMARWKPEHPKMPMTAVGVDVARGGKDKTVLSTRYGSWFSQLKKYEGKVTTDGHIVANFVLETRKDKAHVNVDAIGIGASVYDILKEHSWFETNPVNNAEAKIIANHRDRSGRLKFTNVRAASYWRLRESLDPALGDGISLPPDNELLADLCSAKYKVQAGGIRVEPKEEIVDRIGRSPDCADAVVLSWWTPFFKMVGPAARVMTFGQKSKSKLQRIIICTHEELPTVVTEHPALLVMIGDYRQEKDETLLNNSIVENPGRKSGLLKLLDTVRLDFAPIDLAVHQQKVANGEAEWNGPVEPYGKPAHEVVFQDSHGKELWSHVTRKRPIPWEVLVMCGDRDRALTLAMAVCDQLHLPRPMVLYRPGEPEWQCGNKDHPPSTWLYDEVRSCRASVI